MNAKPRGEILDIADRLTRRSKRFLTPVRHRKKASMVKTNEQKPCTHHCIKARENNLLEVICNQTYLIALARYLTFVPSDSFFSPLHSALFLLASSGVWPMRTTEKQNGGKKVVSRY